MRRVIEPLLLEVDVSAVLLLEAEAHGRRANLDADGSDLRDHLLHVLPVPQLVPDGPLPVHVAADGGDMPCQPDRRVDDLVGEDRVTGLVAERIVHTLPWASAGAWR